MSCIWNKNRFLMIGLILAVLSGVMLFDFARMSQAAERGFGHREFIDSRHGHNHAYPARGQFIERLPNGYRAVVYGNSRYYFHEGVWYRPDGLRFAIVAPPFGLFVPFLPPYYTTIMLGGVPYYYANDVYYTQSAGGYIVVEPPKGEVKPVLPATTGQIFLYPRKGQNEQQQAKDRYECHSWAVSQTSYDPTQPASGVPESQMNQKRADYQRAIGACLDARGYTVK